MGKEIVYCGDCGKSLREDDFSKGKAQELDHQPYCTDCKPLPAGPSTQAHTSSKIAALKVTTGRHAPPPAPSTRRRPSEADSSKTPLLVGAALIVAAVLILLVFALSSNGRPAAPEALPSPAPTAGPPKPAPKPAPAPVTPPNPDKAAAAIKDLEAFAGGSAPPIAVLQKCDEIRPLVQGTPHEARLKGIEERTREARRVQQLDASLEEVKKLRALDPGYERKEEIVRLLSATLPLSGSRRPDVEETLRTYQRDAHAYVPAGPKPTPAPAPAPASAGPLGSFETDATGCVNHWLVLGPFENRNGRDGLYIDRLKTEATHVPAPGLEVAAGVAWTPVAVDDGKISFRKAITLGSSDGPAIVYAACWLVSDREQDVKFRTLGEMGYSLMLDQKRLRNHSPGQPFGGPEDVTPGKLTPGPHLVMFKVYTTGEPLAARLRLTTADGKRAPGLKVWNQLPGSRKVLYAQSFNESLDGFNNGTLADDGIGGTKALMVANIAAKDGVLKSLITAETTIRFKVKVLTDYSSFQVMMWSNKVRQNYWYHFRDLKKGEWTAVELKLADLRAGYKMDGPGPEGDLPTNLRFHIEARGGIEGRALLDDLEILE